jgi:MFS transporter, ACS family, tartrate transporter
LGATHSTFSSIFFLGFASVGIYSVYGPFWSLPSEFLTGFAAASGMALISPVANLGGFAGPYAVGMVSQKTGSLYGGLALTGISLFVCATLHRSFRKRRVLAQADRVDQDAGVVDLRHQAPMSATQGKGFFEVAISD